MGFKEESCRREDGAKAGTTMNLPSSYMSCTAYNRNPIAYNEHSRVHYTVPIEYNEYPMVQYALPMAYNEHPMAHYTLPMVYNEYPMVQYALPTTYNGHPIVYNGFPMAYYEDPIAQHGLPMKYNRHPIAKYRLPMMYNEHPMAYNGLPMAKYALPMADYALRITYNEYKRMSKKKILTVGADFRQTNGVDKLIHVFVLETQPEGCGYHFLNYDVFSTLPIAKYGLLMMYNTVTLLLFERKSTLETLLSHN